MQVLSLVPAPPTWMALAASDWMKGMTRARVWSASQASQAPGMQHLSSLPPPAGYAGCGEWYEHESSPSQGFLTLFSVRFPLLTFTFPPLDSDLFWKALLVKSPILCM